MQHQRYLIQWKAPTLGKAEGYTYHQARMAEAEEEVVAVNGVRRQVGVQVEQEQSGSLKKCSGALTKEFRCGECALG